MKHFCIIANMEKEMAYEMSEKIKNYLLEHQKDCMVLKYCQYRLIFLQVLTTLQLLLM